LTRKTFSSRWQRRELAGKRCAFHRPKLYFRAPKQNIAETARIQARNWAFSAMKRLAARRGVFQNAQMS
jgi:hypothetical protein